MPSLKLSIFLLMISTAIYPPTFSAIAKTAAGVGNGITIQQNGRIVGYSNIGQVFTDGKYFHGRPSVVNFNAGRSWRSNKGTSNPDYLSVVKARIDSFLVHNPGISKSDIPADLVTASGSGLDPNISIKAARVQIIRVAGIRNLQKELIQILLNKHPEKPLLGILGSEKINV